MLERPYVRRKPAVRRLGKLLRHRRLVRRRTDGTPVRRHHTRGGGQVIGRRAAGRGVRHASGRPLRRGAARLGDPQRPWHRLGSAAAVIGACGLAGFVYTLIVTRRATRQTGYKPVLEDWVWHSI